MKGILDYCVSEGISEFADLVERVFAEGRDDWIDIITCRNTLFLSAYLKSKSYRDVARNSEKVIRERREKLKDLPSALGEVD